MKAYAFNGKRVYATKCEALKVREFHFEVKTFWESRDMAVDFTYYTSGKIVVAPGDGTSVSIETGQWYVVIADSMSVFVMGDDYFRQHTDSSNGSERTITLETPKTIVASTVNSISAVMQRATEVPAVDGFGFSAALITLKDGGRVARVGWNGKGMWLMLVNPPHDVQDEAYVDCTVRPQWDLQLHANHDVDRLLPWIGMRTADAGFVPWLASQTDLLVEDWQVVA